MQKQNLKNQWKKKQNATCASNQHIFILNLSLHIFNDLTKWQKTKCSIFWNPLWQKTPWKFGYRLSKTIINTMNFNNNSPVNLHMCTTEPKFAYSQWPRKMEPKQNVPSSEILYQLHNLRVNMSQITCNMLRVRHVQIGNQQTENHRVTRKRNANTKENTQQKENT